MENKENKELTEEQIKEKEREYALESLNNNYITNLASVGFSKPEEGRVPKYGMLLSGLYESTTKDAPDQTTYDALFKEQLKNGGSVNRDSLVKKATAIVTYSVVRVKPKDILELVGSQEAPKGEYGNKKVGELSEEEQKNIVTLYVNYMINKKAGETLAEEEKALVGGLEEILCKEKEPEKPAVKPTRAPVKERSAQPARAVA